jgi:hypothetical protein
MADNISGRDVVSVLENTSKVYQINIHNGSKLTFSNSRVGSGSDSVDRGESDLVINPKATDAPNSTLVAAANPASDNEAGLIPVGDGQVPASVVLRSVHFEPPTNEDDELIQTNFLKLLQPSALQNFTRPATVTLTPPYNPPVITARETREEQFGVVEESVPAVEPGELQEAEEYVPVAYNEYEYSEPDPNRYGLAINALPMQARGSQLMANGPEPFLNNYSPSVTCTFGLMKRRGDEDRSLSFIPENFNAAESSGFWHRFNTQATISTGLVFL